MELQRMRYDDINEGGKNKKNIREVVCAVNPYVRGGEFTFCGNAIPDANMKEFSTERMGDSYKGKIKDITCDSCREVIDYIKRSE
jgi:hypothetical protein